MRGVLFPCHPPPVGLPYRGRSNIIMTAMNLYILLADIIVVIHFAYVAFVAAGLGAIILGYFFRWGWTRNFWFRLIHLIMIAVVVIQSLCGVYCPLTVWEEQLRAAGGQTLESGGFVARWLSRLLFVDMSLAELTVYYVAFGAAVLLTFIISPPRWPRK